MKPLLVSSGEPAGIGPDICLALAKHQLPVVVLGDKLMLAERADRLGLNIDLIDYSSENPFRPNCLSIYSIPCVTSVTAGMLNPANSSYVIALLRYAVQACLANEFSGLVTAPVHKGIINQAGISFTGHTEFLATECQTETVVMMLSCDVMKVALVTTHIPLKQVPDAITAQRIREIIRHLYLSLIQDFGVNDPCILVAGLNPHAGENGYLGHEEIEIITPLLNELRAEGIKVEGPFPADTLFTPYNLKRADAFLAMYHDQGLTVLKYAGFGKSVNITLGLPIVRTSVDHGTALELAGTGKAETGSLLAAVSTAITMIKNRYEN